MKTKYRVTFYEPWLLGFCKWELALVNVRGLTFVRVVEHGRWLWRGINAKSEVIEE